MTLIGLGGGSDDRLGEALVLHHPVGKGYATEFAAAILVGTPCRPCENRPDNHLYPESLAFQPHSDHRVGSGELPVRTDIAGDVKKLGCNLVEHLSLEGDAFGQDDIESRDAVGGHHDQQIVVDIIHITHFTMVNALLSVEFEIGLS